MHFTVPGSELCLTADLCSAWVEVDPGDSSAPNQGWGPRDDRKNHRVVPDVKGVSYRSIDHDESALHSERDELVRSSGRRRESLGVVHRVGRQMLGIAVLRECLMVVRHDKPIKCAYSQVPSNGKNHAAQKQGHFRVIRPPEC